MEKQTQTYKQQIKKGGYKKKKKAKKKLKNGIITKLNKSYRERYGDEWEEKLNNTYERMLSKLDES